MVKSRSGFTIVELLIVIVVIAILAAISIVAYNGIQERSRNTQTMAGAKEYIKALSLYAIDNGSYPNTGAACLGEGYNYNGDINRCGGNVGIYPDVAFDTALSEYMSTKPRLDSTNIIIYSGNTRAGGYYDKNVGSYGVVYYVLAGKTASCDAGGFKSLSADAGITGFYCSYFLPQP